MNNLNKLVKVITNGYQAINEIKYTISEHLCKFEILYKNNSKLLEMKKSTPTFQHFLIEYLGKTYSQVIPVLRVGRYLKKVGVSILDIATIPINKFEIIAKADVEWTEDVYHDLLSMGFRDLKEKYETKKYSKIEETIRPSI